LDDFRFCPFCAEPLQPFSDGERLRLSCPACGWVHYRNPTVGVAVMVLRQHSPTGAQEILLGRRRDGGWCIPCGHVEWDESIQEAARREFQEETGLQVELGPVYDVHSNFHNPEQHTVGVWFRGQVQGGRLQAGGDLLEVAYCALTALPALKFPTDCRVIARLQAEMQAR
jgi:ADP-ribose pyrophosphatase YjhB (NUDIX family)